MKQGSFPSPGGMLVPGSSSTTTPPSPSQHSARFPGSPVIGWSGPRRLWPVRPGRASPVPVIPLKTFRTLYPEEVMGAALQVLHPVHGLRPDGLGSALPWSGPEAGTLTERQVSRDATDRLVVSPVGAGDTGLRPDPFPGRAASLLPGLLAATRAGLPPASDDELVVRSGVPAPIDRWAHSGVVV